MPHSRDWDNGVPAFGEIFKYGSLRLRQFLENFEERFGVDHVIDSSVDEGADQDGVHKQLTMKAQNQDLINSFETGVVGFTSETDYDAEENNIEFNIYNAEGEKVQITRDGSLNSIKYNTVHRIREIDTVSLLASYRRSVPLHYFYISRHDTHDFDEHILFSEISNGESSDIGISSVFVTIPEDGKYFIEFSAIGDTGLAITASPIPDYYNIVIHGFFVVASFYSPSAELVFNLIIKKNSAQIATKTIGKIISVEHIPVASVFEPGIISIIDDFNEDDELLFGYDISLTGTPLTVSYDDFGTKLGITYLLTNNYLSIYKMRD